MDHDVFNLGGFGVFFFEIKMSAQREGPVPHKININYYAVKD